MATTPPPATTPPVTAPATCPSWSEPVVTGRLDPKLRETSGLAASRLTPGVLWAHNDSGNAAVLYALDETGALVAELPLPVVGLDWEDMAAGPGPDGSPYLWVADTGDNLTLRPNVTIYRLPEPTVAPGAPAGTLPATGLERITVAYPDGPHDVETLLVDPVTGDAFLVGKETDQDRTVPVYRLPATDLGDGARVDAELVGRVVGRAEPRQRPDGGRRECRRHAGAGVQRARGLPVAPRPGAAARSRLRRAARRSVRRAAGGRRGGGVLGRRSTAVGRERG